MTNRTLVIWFWALVAFLAAQNTLDMVLLRLYTSPNSHETFPLLAHTLQSWGLDASIWTIRGILYSFVLVLMLVKRSIPASVPYLVDVLISTNAVYLSGMWDELFFTGILPTPK